MASSQAPSNCCHIGASIGSFSVVDIDRFRGGGGGGNNNNETRCLSCGFADGNLWFCLYPKCYFVGCSETKTDHSTAHFSENPSHTIQLNLSNKRMWCYVCNKEVLLKRDSTAWQQFGKILSPSSSIDGSDGGGGIYEARPASEQPESNRSLGLVGFSNLGNTCYMNAALQCLSNTPPLTEFFISCPAHVGDVKINNNNNGISLSKAYRKLLADVWNGKLSYVAPSGVMHAVKQAHPMFGGFHQHDAQEFLRCFMDQLHEELMEPVSELENGENAENNPDPDLESNASSSNASNEEEEEEQEEYETADSGVSEDSSASGVSISASSRKRKNEEPSRNTKKASEAAAAAAESSSPSDIDLEFNDCLSSRSASPPSRPQHHQPPQQVVVPRSPFKGNVIRKRKPKTYRSVISDIFDGKLVSTVQCLSCDRISTTTETFQDLSLPIPTTETLNDPRHQTLLSGSAAAGGSSAQLSAANGNEGWFSWMWNWISGWFYGPNVTLNDCLAYFFSADELKGDNMYSCERCKKLRNGIKYSRVTVLPETLCIHLKRFRHDFAFSSKISCKVTFPVVDLDMSQWLHKDCKSKESTYDLTGIVCHMGTAGGGHYVAYCLNPVDQEWYEFDDSVVSRVDPATVMSVEAYVLFYRKNNDRMEGVRQEVQSLLRKAQTSPSLMRFYVSKQWLNKFENFAEPGPIDNSDFLCPHGGVHPAKADIAYELFVALPQSVWEYLHHRFGGGPACTRVYECLQCRAEMDALTRQKKFELDEFRQLYTESEEKNEISVLYCLSSSWFKTWEGFVRGRNRDPPGPIDNKAIITTRNGVQTLRTTSDYLKFSEEIWRLFHSIYGGGPEVVVHAGGVTVSNPRSPSLSAFPARFRARSTSEIVCSSNPQVTRSKYKSETDVPNEDDE